MAASTVIGKITNLFMRLNETTADVFYDQPEIYLKCIKAGAKYLRKEHFNQIIVKQRKNKDFLLE